MRTTLQLLCESFRRFSTSADAEWAKVARRRLSELRGGSVKAVLGDEVFAKIRARFEK